MKLSTVVASLAKEVMFSIALVYLSVCEQHSKSDEWIAMKFYGGVRGGTMKQLNFGSDLGLHR